MTPVLHVDNLSKHYGSVHAVKGISLDIAPGEIFGLLGPNGAGKTTTLECILGLRRPDAGTVLVSGIDILKQPAGAKEVIGAQLQSSALQDKLTPRQALQLFGSFYPQQENAADLLQQFELTEKADQPYDALSFGQRRRLEIALALVHQPKLLLLDEPTAGMDPLGRQALHACIQQLKSSGRAILLTTHHIEEAHRLCDRVAILEKGSITAQDTPDALIAASKVPPWLIIRASGELTHQQLRALPGVTYTHPVQNRWRFDTTDMDQTIRELMRLLESLQFKLLELEIHRPTLEDVFLERIGQSKDAGGNA